MTDITAAQADIGVTRSLQGRFGPMRIALITYMIGEAGLVLLNAVEAYFRMGSGIDIYAGFGAVSTGLVFGLVVIGLAQFGGLIGSIILVAMWTFRAMKNLHIVGAKGAEMSPGWAVGWYFIPFANLWKPFEGMLQIWRESHRMAGQPEKVAPYVGWWWATWIGSNILANISLRLTGWGEPLPTYDSGLVVAVVASSLSVICTMLLLRTTARVTRMQGEMRVGGLADTFS